MKYILLILLLTSCATKRVKKSTQSKPQQHFYEKVENCMLKFSKEGYDSEALVRICGKVFERRN